VLALRRVILAHGAVLDLVRRRDRRLQELYVKVVLVYLLAVNVLVSPARLERLTWVLSWRSATSHPARSSTTRAA
jgi:hypothetical protein